MEQMFKLSLNKSYQNKTVHRNAMSVNTWWSGTLRRGSCCDNRSDCKVCHCEGKSGCRDMQETVANAVSFMIGICDGRLENHYVMIPHF